MWFGYNYTTINPLGSKTLSRGKRHTNCTKNYMGRPAIFDQHVKLLVPLRNIQHNTKPVGDVQQQISRVNVVERSEQKSSFCLMSFLRFPVFWVDEFPTIPGILREAIFCDICYLLFSLCSVSLGILKKAIFDDICYLLLFVVCSIFNPFAISINLRVTL